MQRRDRVHQVADLLTVALTHPNIPRTTLCGMANLNSYSTPLFQLAVRRGLLDVHENARSSTVTITEKGRRWLVHACEVLDVLYPNVRRTHNGFVR